MDAPDRRFIAAFGEFIDMCLEERHREQGDGPALRDVLEAHLARAPTDVPVARLDVPSAEFVNLDVAIEALVEASGGGELIGVGGGDQRHHATFADMMQRNFGRVPVASVDRARVETGPDSARDAVSFGIHLFRFEGEPVAVLQRRSDPRFGMQCGLEVMAERATADRILAETKRLMVERNVFRGQVLSFAVVGGEYEPSTGGVRFHRRPDLPAEAVVLPDGSLSRIERHVVGASRHREALLAAGQHLKRGLLLYGPPGTGKTHTIRYLLGRLPGVTCFLLSGNSLSFISETTALAQALQPSVIVLEDVDLIAEERGMHGPQPFLFSLLDAMDGLAGESDIAFILSTNRADLLERALSQRPGRIDLAVEVPLPDAASRLALLRLYTRALPLSDAALVEAAERAEGVTASFFKELTRRTVLVAAEDGIGVGDDLVLGVLEEMLTDAASLARSLLGVGSVDAVGEPPGPGLYPGEGAVPSTYVGGVADHPGGVGWFRYGPDLHP